MLNGSSGSYSEDEILLHCKKCGKRIIGRRQNGLFHFLFGKKKEKDGSMRPYCPVEMMIHGSVKIRCLARECGEWNVFNIFPSEQSTPVETDNQK